MAGMGYEFKGVDDTDRARRYLTRIGYTGTHPTGFTDLITLLAEVRADERNLCADLSNHEKAKSDS